MRRTNLWPAAVLLTVLGLLAPGGCAITPIQLPVTFDGQRSTGVDGGPKGFGDAADVKSDAGPMSPGIDASATGDGGRRERGSGGSGPVPVGELGLVSDGPKLGDAAGPADDGFELVPDGERAPKKDK